MLKHGILGLLNYGSMTGYDIDQVFKNSLNYFWKAQTSQIYRELQTLEKNEFVVMELIKQNGKPDKKVFSITQKGIDELNKWLMDDSIRFDIKSPMLMHTFFRGERSIEENIEFFKKLKKENEEIISDELSTIGNVESYERLLNNKEKSIYWKMTMEFGKMYMQMVNEWVDKCVSELEDMKNESISD